MSVITGEYTKALTLLEDIRESAGHDIKLPQICVVGDQSSGKSSLLSSLIGTQGLLPEGAGIVTKCPIVVQLQPGNSVAFYVSAGHASSNDSVTDSSDTDPEKENPPSEGKSCAILSKYDTVDEACAAIKRAQNRILQRECSKVSQTPVRVRCVRPNIPNLVIVDLPGIIHFGDGVKEVRDVIKTYITPEETLIVVVRPAEADTETQEALKFARQADPNELRTLEVYTKCDSFSSPANLKKATQILEQGVANNELRQHAVCCRENGENILDAQAEINLLLSKFKFEKDDCNILGVKVLQRRMEKLLAERVKENVPRLEHALNTKRLEANKELDKLGHDPKARSTIVHEFIDELRSREVPLRGQLTEEINKFSSQLRATKECITQEWVNKHFRADAFEAPFFQGSATFKECARILQRKWRTSLEVLLHKLVDVMRSDSLLVHNQHFPSSLLRAYKSIWLQHVDELTASLKVETYRDLNKEGEFGTVNHYLTTKYHENMALPSELKDRFAECFTDEVVVVLMESPFTERCKSIRQILDNYLDQNLTEYSKLSLEEQTKKRVLAAINAHWWVEHKTFGDMVLKAVRDVIVNDWRTWMARVEVASEISTAAVEEPATLRKREEYRSTKLRMEQCLKKIETLKSLTAGEFTTTN